MAPYLPLQTTLPSTPAQTPIPPYAWVDETVASVCLAIAPPVVLLIWLILRHQRKAKALARAQAQPCRHEQDVDIRSRSPFISTQDARYISTLPRTGSPEIPALADATPPPEPSDNVSPPALPSTARHTRMQSMSTESCSSQTSMVTLYRQHNVSFTPATLGDPFADFSAIHHEGNLGTEDHGVTEEDDGIAANPPTAMYFPYTNSDSGIGEMRIDSGFHVSVSGSELYNGSATSTTVSLTPSLVAVMQIAILSAEHMRTAEEENAIEGWLATYEEWAEEWSDEWMEETGDDGETGERGASGDGSEREEDGSASARDDADLYAAD